MAFPPAFLDELNARNPIEDVVGQYVALTRRGSNLFGLCPFHGEKTPSFSVAPEKGIFYCFGCHKGGGVVNFIMEEENLSFPDAVRFLAKRANIPVPEEASDGTEKLRRRMLELEERGTPEPYAAILRAIQERDWNDTHRDAAPLRQAEDAVLLDTTALDFVQSEDALLHIIRERTGL